jgi:hypothetical protein
MAASGATRSMERRRLDRIRRTGRLATTCPGLRKFAGQSARPCRRFRARARQYGPVPIDSAAPMLRRAKTPQPFASSPEKVPCPADASALEPPFPPAMSNNPHDSVALGGRRRDSETLERRSWAPPSDAGGTSYFDRWPRSFSVRTSSLSLIGPCVPVRNGTRPLPDLVR